MTPPVKDEIIAYIITMGIIYACIIGGVYATFYR